MTALLPPVHPHWRDTDFFVFLVIPFFCPFHPTNTLESLRTWTFVPLFLSSQQGVMVGFHDLEGLLQPK